MLCILVKWELAKRPVDDKLTFSGLIRLAPFAVARSLDGQRSHIFAVDANGFGYGRRSRANCTETVPDYGGLSGLSGRSEAQLTSPGSTVGMVAYICGKPRPHIDHNLQVCSSPPACVLTRNLGSNHCGSPPDASDRPPANRSYRFRCPAHRYRIGRKLLPAIHLRRSAVQPHYDWGDRGSCPRRSTPIQRIVR